MDWKRCIPYQKDSVVPLPDPSRNRNNTVYGYIILKNNIEEFQRSEVPFPVGILVHVNELQEDDWIIQNGKNGKVKWCKNCVLKISASK